VTHFHGSTPDSDIAEDEAFPMEGLRRKNEELEAKIKERTRELEIETALERVRNRAISMRSTEELGDLVITVFQELRALDMVLTRCLLWIFDPEDQSAKAWMTNSEDPDLADSYFVPNHDHPAYKNYLKAWKSRQSKWEYILKGKNKARWDEILVYDYFGSLPEEIKKAMSEPDKVILSGSFNKYGLIQTASMASLKKENQEILFRFSQVFEQSYTRFLDLKKAEEQAREAQVETALERVRSRTMGMQNSDELREVVLVINEQLQKLQFGSVACNIIILNKDTGDANYWVSGFTKDIYPVSYHVPYLDHPYYEALLQPWKKGEPYVVYNYVGEEKKNFDKIFFSKTGFKNVPREAMKEMKGLPSVTLSTAYFANGAIQVLGPEALSDEKALILQRFALVFEQTYTRFLDLKKAEAQAREAQIENALEKVRSRTMAMQQSDELPEAANVLFLEVQALGIPAWSCGYNILAEDQRSATCWMSSEGSLQKPFNLRLWGEASFEEMGAFIRSDKTLLVQELDAKALEEHYAFMLSFPDLQPIFEDLKKEGLELPTYQINHLCKFNHGFLLFITYEPVPEAYDIFKRFTAVFDQTYTRFLDLKNMEAQARESKIETALERVRARALAMQEPEELKEVAQVLRLEMGLLGVEELETSSIYIHDRDANTTECWYAIKDIREKGKIMVTDHFMLDLKDTRVGREMLNFYDSGEDQVSIVMKGDARKEWISYCEARSKALQGYYGEVIPERTYHLYKFSHGAIGVATPAALSEESWSLLKRAASVFSLAYSRFRDLTQARLDLKKLKEEIKRAEDALKELQLTQQQLVHAEKMASLGELTAGIAHEIQNPLNFVNNFSDVSRELLEELLEEMEKGETEEVDAIAKDVIQNLEKIVHHGKRADSIVKGMLQHSRSGDGKKEPTDLNALTDEYFRLAYHGLRAKDKSFNATMDTEFDDSISEVDVVPQDIGRVLLNLITNAFHAVSERKEKESEGYEPTVWVKTRKTTNGVEISVRDNGGGIPAEIRDKIFQPFFTTKPTGEGTGLGLSMSYDIVTKGHGGEFKVETTEGEGSMFTILLKN
ncbi:MAG: ATP-binding protein, partial [Robiginitalea sp.]